MSGDEFVGDVDLRHEWVMPAGEAVTITPTVGEAAVTLATPSVSMEHTYSEVTVEEILDGLLGDVVLRHVRISKSGPRLVIEGSPPYESKP